MALWGLVGQASAADLLVGGATSYDSNVYEGRLNRQGGLTSRVSFSAKGLGLRGSKKTIEIEQQAGFKRFWETAQGFPDAGHIFVEQLFVRGLVSVGQKRRLGIRTGFKFKQATRVPGEESYLRGVLEGDLISPIGSLVTGRLRFGLGKDDSRALLLPQTSHQTVSLDLTYSKKRHFLAHAQLLQRWKGFDRVALGLNKSGHIVSLSANQADRATSLTLGVQLYAGMLVQTDYLLLRNLSNSFGYAFWAHRIKGLVVRHLGMGIDAQVLSQFQVRLYDEKVPEPIDRGADEDAFEQLIAIVKLSRPISPGQAVAAQYGFYRNGAREGDGFYRKHVFSLMFEVEM